MKTVMIAARALMALSFLGVIGVTIYFVLAVHVMAAVSTGALAAIFGYFVYRDVRSLLNGGSSETSNP